MLRGNTLDSTILKNNAALPPMQQFCSKNVSVGKQPRHMQILRISEANDSPPDSPRSHGMAEALDGARTGNGAATPHTSTPVPLSDLTERSVSQGTPQLHQSPTASPQAGNSRPACARAGASSLGLSSVHRNTPMSTLGIRRQER